ncbi:MAG: hypothetical protein NTV58_11855 [Deltaproteobacteria bacterium]|nr:hypothetical protein [Deltaproteobacteria bacterium]
MGGGLVRNLIRTKKSVLVFDLNSEAVKTTRRRRCGRR